VSSLAPRCTSTYYLGTHCGTSVGKPGTRPVRWHFETGPGLPRPPGVRSLGEDPLATVDLDHRPRAVVEAVVLVGGHREDAVRGDELFRVLECIAQRKAEFLRAGLRLLERFGNRAREQQIGIPRVAAEGRA